ncbi:hypothetical protein V6N11_010773 [Hibiscus sabdariffa]|uniref:Ran guanine nucleotide release factor n=1 Tax=Hibiscus sabdariffa TaxID=183260 RepID=A0ABR2S693_9ROSI
MVKYSKEPDNPTKLKMSADLLSERPLFGGAISTLFPLRFQDVSNIRQVPDHQEVFVDPAYDESLIFELLDFKHEVGDDGSAVWFLRDLAIEQDGEGFMLLEQSTVVEAPGLCYKNIPAIVTTAIGQMLLEQSIVVEAPGLCYKNIPAIVTIAIGQMAVSKGRQGREAQNIIKVYLANMRLKEVGTDVLFTAYEPILINPLSESASAVGAGLATPAMQSGLMPMATKWQEVFVDPACDESLIFELLDFKHEVGDDGSAVWFLQDLAIEQDGEGFMLLEQSIVVEAPGLCLEGLQLQLAKWYESFRMVCLEF